MGGWIVARAGSEAQRSTDGVVDGIGDDVDAENDNKDALDPDLLLLPRRLEWLKVDDDKEANRDGNTSHHPPFLRVLSWNTLADGLAQLGRFSRCPEGALSWPRRRRRRLLLPLPLPLPLPAEEQAAAAACRASSS